jgi:IS30 family transposase
VSNRRLIEDRPKIVDLKQRFGDLEIDTIIGKNHKGAIVTINDRATGILRDENNKS